MRRNPEDSLMVFHLEALERRKLLTGVSADGIGYTGMEDASPALYDSPEDNLVVIDGTEGNDKMKFVVSSGQHYVFNLYGGNDRLTLIAKGSGPVQVDVFAGHGNDRLKVKGDPSVPVILFVDAGYGNDKVVIGGWGTSCVHFGPGDDVGKGGKNTDYFNGGTGRDRLFGREGEDDLHGGEDDDILKGGRDNDILVGGRGSDKLFGGHANDILYGGRWDTCGKHDDNRIDLLKAGRGFDLAYLDPGETSDAEEVEFVQ